jgi:hypothetical protein
MVEGKDFSGEPSSVSHQADCPAADNDLRSMVRKAADCIDDLVASSIAEAPGIRVLIAHDGRRIEGEAADVAFELLGAFKATSAYLRDALAAGQFLNGQAQDGSSQQNQSPTQKGHP